MSVRTQTLALIALLALAAACYWPGLRGPWLFDDYPNILENAAIRLDGLNGLALQKAAFVEHGAGPLGRPVAYASFALNHYFADGTASAFPFKLTNLAIHLLNVLLVWALAGLIGRRLWSAPQAAVFALAAAALFALHPIMLSSVLYVVQRMSSLAATFSLAALICWLRARARWPTGGAPATRCRVGKAQRAHADTTPGSADDASTPGQNRVGTAWRPLPTLLTTGDAGDTANTTNVGRVSPAGVTRHTTAGNAQTSGYAALTRPTHSDDANLPTAAVAGMARSYNGNMTGRLAVLGWLLAGGVFFALGLFTKENAVLALPLALLLDAALFPAAWPWRGWDRLTPVGRRWLLLLALVLATVAAWLAARHFAGGYGAREFTLPERLLTEARVMGFYLGLILLPRISAFGLHHDDIALSTGMLTPWTTLPAVLGLALLAGFGLWALRRRPLLGIGILWFLIGHSLEGSFIPLEIAHEHRNYLPALGPFFLLAGGFCHLWVRLPRRQTALLAGVVVAVLAGTTALRASQWQDDFHFSSYEVAHHPNSARARNDLASDLARLGDFAGARREAEAAVRLAPDEVGNRINLANIVLAQGDTLAVDAQERIETLLTSRPLTAFGTLTLKRYAECIETNCKHLAPHLARWLAVYLASEQPKFDQSYAWYLNGLSLRAAGDAAGALNAFEKSFALDGGFLHPLFEQANIFMALGQWDNAAFNLERLRAANQTAPVRQDKAIAELEAAIAKGRGGKEAATRRAGKAQRAHADTAPGSAADASTPDQNRVGTAWRPLPTLLAATNHTPDTAQPPAANVGRVSPTGVTRHASTGEG